jgi:uncharacterized coiled-coil DUF342 family protein
MAVEWHDPLIVIPSFTAWTGLLVGLLRWSLQRNLKSVEASIIEAANKATQAIKDADALKDDLPKALRDMDKELVQRCAGHNGRLSESEKKIARIGAEIRNLPQHRHIMDLSARIEQLHGDVHEVSGSLRGLSRAVDLMNEFLINQGGKR